MLDFLTSVCVYTANYLRDTFAHFLDKDFPPDIPELHRFSNMGNKPTVEDLIARQVDVNQTHSYHLNNEAVTALAAATNPVIIQMLMEAGGIDSHDLKILGHSLGLQGTINLKGKHQSYPVNYEGLSEETTFPIIAHHIGLFEKRMQDEGLAWNESEKKAFNIVATAFDQFVRYRNDKFFSFAQSYHQGLPVIIRCTWSSHTGFALLYKDKLYIANKGGNTLIPSISCYQVDATYLRGLSEVAFSSLIEQLSQTRSSLFSSNLSLAGFKKLRAQLLYYKRLSRQKNKTCSYSNVKRGVDVFLTAFLDDTELTFMRSVNKEKLYRAFTMFDRLRTIDEYIQKYKQSPNPQVWEPLFNYLLDKSGLGERTHYVAAHIINKLKSPPLSFTDDEILYRMNQVKPERSFWWKLYTIAARVEDVIFEKEKRVVNLKKLGSHLPCIWHYQRKGALRDAGLDLRPSALKNPMAP